MSEIRFPKVVGQGFAPVDIASLKYWEVFGDEAVEGIKNSGPLEDWLGTLQEAVLTKREIRDKFVQFCLALATNTRKVYSIEEIKARAYAELFDYLESRHNTIWDTINEYQKNAIEHKSFDKEITELNIIIDFEIFIVLCFNRGYLRLSLVFIGIVILSFLNNLRSLQHY